MAITVHRISPVAHLPLILGMLRKLDVAGIIDGLLPPNPAHVLASGRGVEALILAILDGHHALYKVGSRLEERGMVPLLQSGLDRTALHDYRLGQILDALFAANLNRVFCAVALRALEVYAISTPWLHQDTTTLTLYGAYEEATRPDGQAPQAPAGPVPPRPAYGHSKDGHDDLKQVLLSLGVSSDGGLPLRLGVRDGNTSDSTETQVAIEECLALGLAVVVRSKLLDDGAKDFDQHRHVSRQEWPQRELRMCTRHHHRTTFQVVVPSLWSSSSIRIALSSSRMRSDSLKFLVLRAALRASMSFSIATSSKPLDVLRASAVFIASQARKLARSKPRNAKFWASSTAYGPTPGSLIRFRIACSSAIALGVFRSSVRAASTVGDISGGDAGTASLHQSSNVAQLCSSPLSVQSIG